MKLSRFLSAIISMTLVLFICTLVVGSFEVTASDNSYGTDTIARICETLNCEITDVIELVPDEPASTGGKEHERIETKNNGKRN